MERKEIFKMLKETHPGATNIYKNEFGLWDIEIEDDYEIVTLTYAVEGTQLRFIGEMTVEQ